MSGSCHVFGRLHCAEGIVKDSHYEHLIHLPDSTENGSLSDQLNWIIQKIITLPVFEKSQQLLWSVNLTNKRFLSLDKLLTSSQQTDEITLSRATVFVIFPPCFVERAIPTPAAVVSALHFHTAPTYVVLIAVCIACAGRRQWLCVYLMRRFASLWDWTGSFLPLTP